MIDVLKRPICDSHALLVAPKSNHLIPTSRTTMPGRFWTIVMMTSAAAAQPPNFSILP